MGKMAGLRVSSKETERDRRAKEDRGAGETGGPWETWVLGRIRLDSGGQWRQGVQERKGVKGVRRVGDTEGTGETLAVYQQPQFLGGCNSME